MEQLSTEVTKLKALVLSMSTTNLTQSGDSASKSTPPEALSQPIVPLSHSAPSPQSRSHPTFNSQTSEADR